MPTPTLLNFEYVIIHEMIADASLYLKHFLSQSTSLDLYVKRKEALLEPESKFQLKKQLSHSEPASPASILTFSEQPTSCDSLKSRTPGPKYAR